jgi:RimJ/RimL family protein N-acetyltransferase
VFAQRFQKVATGKLRGCRAPRCKRLPVSSRGDSTGLRAKKIVQVSIRDVRESDLPLFFLHQLDPDANSLFNSQTVVREEFMAHWQLIKQDAGKIAKTVVADGKVAGYFISWEQFGKRLVGFWLGKEFSGRGVATAGLSRFLSEVKPRPLHARVAKQNLASMRVLHRSGFAVHEEGQFMNMCGEIREEFILLLGTDDRIEMA